VTIHLKSWTVVILMHPLLVRHGLAKADQRTVGNKPRASHTTRGGKKGTRTSDWMGKPIRAMARFPLTERERTGTSSRMKDVSLSQYAGSRFTSSLGHLHSQTDRKGNGWRNESSHKIDYLYPHSLTATQSHARPREVEQLCPAVYHLAKP
jgi:hypothetical protein